jgi:Divergent InlB B-repeat domain
MIALKINSKFAVLSPKTAMNFIINAKFWELDFLKGSRSFTFKLPCEPINQEIFNFPEDVPNSNKDIFKDYEAEIHYNGTFLYSGKFKLRNANKNYYDGFFKFEAADIADFAETPIRELLKNEVYTFPNTDLIALNDYTDIDSNIVFPTCKFGNDIFNRYDGTNYYHQTDFNEGTFVAFLKLHHVVAMVFQKINYKLENPTWYLNYADIKKITVWNNKELEMVVTTTYEWTNYEGIEAGETGNIGSLNEIRSIALPAKIKLAELVPNYTVSKFLNVVRKLCGLHFSFNNTFKTVKISFFKGIFNQENYIDWTEKANPNHEVKEVAFNGIQFSFKKDSKDKYQDAQKEPDISLQKLAKKDTLGPLHWFDITETVANTYRFYKQENQYFKVTNPLGEVRLRSYLADFLPYKIGEGTQKIDIDCSPVRKSRFLQFTLKDPYAEASKNPTGKIRLRHNNRLAGLDGYIYIAKANNQQADTFFGLFGSADTESYIDTPFTWRKDEDGVQLIRFWRTDPILETDSPMTRKLLNIENQDFAFRVFFYHGLQQRKDNDTTYPYASPDSISPRGNELTDFSLRFEEKGLIDYFYGEYLNFIQYSNLYEFPIYLNITDLLNFKATNIIRIRESKFVVEDIDISISNKIEPAKVKMRKLVSMVKNNTRKVIINYRENCLANTTRKVIINYRENCTPTPSPQNFTVTVAAEAGGTASNLGVNSVRAGENFIFSVAPNSQYKIVAILLNGSPTIISNANGQIVELKNIQSNLEIVCQFQFIPVPLPTYTVTFANGAGGTTSPNTSQVVSEGGDLEFEAIPAIGFEINTVTLNGNAYTLPNRLKQTLRITNIQGDRAVVASYRSVFVAPTSFKVIVNAGSGGTSNKLGENTVQSGNDFTYTAIPNSGQEIDTIFVGVNQITISDRTGSTPFSILAITSGKVVDISFRATTAATHTVTLTAGAGGTASPLNTTTVKKGEDYNYSLTPSAGYEIDVLTIGGSPVTLTSRAAQARSLKNIQANQIIAVTYRLIAVQKFTVTVVIDSNMTSNPVAGTYQVNAGSKFDYTFTPNNGYELDNFTAGTNTITPTNRNGQAFSIAAVTGNITITGKSKVKIIALSVTLNFDSFFGYADKPKIVGISQGDQYNANVGARDGYEIDTIFLNQITPVVITNRDLQPLQYFNIQANMVFDILFRSVQKYSGYIRYAQLNSNSIQIDKTFGDGFNTQGWSEFIGQTVNIEYNDQPNSNLIILMSGTLLSVSGNNLTISGVLTPFQDGYRNQSFKASFVNLSINLNKKYTG